MLTAGQADRMGAIARSLQAERVGGAFWARPASLARDGMIVFQEHEERPARRRRDALIAAHGAEALWAVLPDTAWARRLAAESAALGVGASLGEVDPWSLLDGARAVVAAPESDLGLLAALLGRLQGKTAAEGAVMAHEALIEGAEYHCPFDGRAAACEEIIGVLADWRRTLASNRGLAVAVGVAPWKRREIRRLLVAGPEPLPFRRSGRAATALARRRGGAVAVWPSRAPRDLDQAAAESGAPVASIEDGFIRSAGLGSELWAPASIAVDRRRPHFDPRGPSDLETILQETAFDPELLLRARRLVTLIQTLGVTKYNFGEHSILSVDRHSPTVLVTGQVEDDLSFTLGGGVSNFALLQKARALEPDAHILFKPHPDVERGHRKGRLDDRDALRFANDIVRNASMAALLESVDRLHTVSSLSGFEALLRGRTVVVHGMPFYAGWGLTTDLQPIARRTRRLTVEELAAGALILYPRYIDPSSGLPCPPEVLVKRLAERRGGTRPSLLTRLRVLQGKSRRWIGPVGITG